MKIVSTISPPPNTAGYGGSGYILFRPDELNEIERLMKGFSYFPAMGDDNILLDKFRIKDYEFRTLDGEYVGEARFRFLRYIDRVDLL